MPKRLDRSEFTRRVDIIRRMTRAGMERGAIARELGISGSALCQFANRYLNEDGSVKSGEAPKTEGVHHTVADLTEDQLRLCHAAGITPKRMAELLSCPRGGNAAGWRGGSAIG